MRRKFKRFATLTIPAIILCTSCKKDNNDNDASPKITSFFPQSGARGSAVLIGGSNFSTILADNKVTFNGKPANLISTTGTSLLVEVPVSPGIGRIAVTVKGHTDSTAANFNYQAAVIFLAGSLTNGYADGNGSNAQFSYPDGIVFDNNGSLLIASVNKIRRMNPDYEVSTVAGTDDRGSTNGPANTSKFNYPSDMVSDAAGNIYVSDTYNHTVRKIAKDGTVSTIAGSAGLYAFVDGQGAAARLNFPQGITIDKSGNLYVADAHNNCIRKITPDGMVSVFAGTITPGFQDGTGLAARFKDPTDIVIDAAGNLYVSDAGNYSIRKVTPAGEVTTITGNGAAGYKDGSKGIAQLGSIQQLCLDNSGSLLLADYDNSVLRKTTMTGEVSTVAGVPQSDIYVGDITRVSLPYISGIAVAPSGLIYLADRYGIKTFY